MSEQSKEKGPSRPLEVRDVAGCSLEMLDCSHVQLEPPPDYLKTRIDIFDRLKADYDAMIAGIQSDL